RVRSQLPAPSPELLLKAAREAVRVNQQVGVTAWMDAAANGGGEQSLFEMRPTEHDLGVLPLYRQLAKKGELNVHVAALLLAHPQSKPDDLAVLDQVMAQFKGVPNLSFPGIKIFADGVMEFPGQTAAVLDPFKNSLKRGELLIDPAHFGKLVVAAEQRNWVVHMHAVGDRAVRESLNGFEYARRLSPAPLPHSISHLQLVNPQEFPRFKQLGVIASMQLLWATAESYTEELVKPYVSPMTYQYQYPARSLHKAGATIAGASDWPVSSPNPWNAIAQASTRKGPLGVLNAKESIDRESMFYAYTLNAAKALRLDQQIGSLAPGKQADLIVLDRDVFKVSDAELFDTQVLETFFAGQSVYRAEPAPAVAQAQ
ncbi:MAG: amidohydrolase family protein, partial [Pseudomonas sp.]|nr:amidohydrolase family protein [Pseudomonas sp.]